MSTQTSRPSPAPETVEQQVFVELVRTHAALTRRLSGDLLEHHGLTLNDYEVLLHLAVAPDRRMRRVDLADRIVLTPSGITRLLAGLERAGYVDRAACDTDARVVYAVLTDTGMDKLQEARPTHLEGIRAAFAERFSDDELSRLAGLLERAR